jgi:hypothetical protein
MHSKSVAYIRPMLPVLFLALALPALAGFDEKHSFSTDSLTVNNLIGEVRVTGHGGSAFEVHVSVKGSDATRELIEIRSEEGSKARLTIAFPIQEHRNYVYPGLGSQSKTSFTIDKQGDSWLSSLLGALSSRKITVRSSGLGLEAWADVEIRVPAGASLKVNHGVGEINAKNVNGKLNLDNHSGAIEISQVKGDTYADTGSGHVTLSGIDGKLYADTGSGHVEAENCTGDSITIDTGSGHVTVREMDTPKLKVDTGSGAVKAYAIRADNALIDTGSGSVKLELQRMGEGDFRIDTGSGHVTLALPAGASAEISAETGSGGIDFDLDEPVQLHRKERDELRFTVGDGAAKVSIDTGSGRIEITRAG